MQESYQSKAQDLSQSLQSFEKATSMIDSDRHLQEEPFEDLPIEAKLVVNGVKGERWNDQRMK